MSTFHAYNIEYDSSDSEVDDTKELQIEEALKLYQTALKLHSEGPASFPQAAKAYQELFRSEIFAYPESLSELRRSETLLDYDELLQEAFDPSAAQPLIVATDAAPNTLPQILHLSYKNHGLFVLDYLSYRVKQHVAEKNEPFGENVADVAKKSLNYFAEALDKDENDLDLWRQSAFAATLAGSYRIARYCLESVLDGDLPALEGGELLEYLGIDEMLSLHQLRSLSRELQDDLSMLMEPLSSGRKRKLSATLMQLIDPHPDVPRPTVEEAAYSEIGHYGKEPAKYVITPPILDWTSVGKTILQQCTLEQSEAVDMGPGPGLGFKVQQTSTVDATPKAESVFTPVDLGNDTAQQKQIETEPENAQLLNNAIKDEAPESPRKNSQINATIEDPTTQEPTESTAKDSGAEGVESNREPDQQQPGRKRSSESAGLPEVAEGGRARSKRLRRRETLHEEGEITLVESAKENQLNEQLAQFLWADQTLYDVLDPKLATFGANGFVKPEELRKIVKNEVTLDDGSMRLLTALQDAAEMMQNADSDGAKALIKSSTHTVSSIESRRAGLKAFMGHDEPTNGSKASLKPAFAADAHLNEWMTRFNEAWMLNKDASWLWLEALLRPGILSDFSVESDSPYLAFVWPEQLKQTVLDMITQTDLYLIQRAREELEKVQQKELSSIAMGQVFELDMVDKSLADMIETFFELHIDIFSALKTTSGTESSAAIAESRRLDRWALLATGAVQLVARNSNGADSLDELSIRHVWAQALRICSEDETSQDHMVASVRDLKTLMESLENEDDGLTIQLPNSVVISEISLQAAKERLRRMNMKDFFIRMFDEKEQDPVVIIESLEPILEASIAEKEDDMMEATSHFEDAPIEKKAKENAILSDTRAFISNGSLSLRLALWRRLRDAYDAIDYPPKAVSCNLRIIEIVMRELASKAYKSHSSQPQRIKLLLRYLQIMDDAISKIISARKTKTGYVDFLECIDEQHLKSSMLAMSQFLDILQVCRLVDDLVSVDQLPTPVIEGRNVSYAALRDKIDATVVYAWLVQWFLFKEATIQFSEKFSNAEEDQVEFLRCVHYTLGARETCDAAHKIFLKVSRNELLSMSEAPGAMEELCQIIYDLYDIKCFHNPLDAMNHEVADHEDLTKPIALKILPMVMVQAQKVPLKDLPRSELKNAIDAVQKALGAPTPARGLAHMNRRVCLTYIRSAVNPLRLRNCIEGIFSLPTKVPTSTIHGNQEPTSAEFSVAASGWYFLVGSIHLAKWRSQKRVIAGSTDDLEDAAKFFLHDLEHRSSENWETWFRLAQTYDSQLEELVTWTAEKMNAGLVATTNADGQSQLPQDVGLTGEIVDYQRRALNCYAMAVSCLVRDGRGVQMGQGEHKEEQAEDPKTREAIATMYSEFGNRVYAASREPFSMRAFQVKEPEERHFNRSQPGDTFMYKAPPFRALKEHEAWKLACVLFRRAIERRNNHWWSHYMLSKCLWKIYQYKGTLSPKVSRPSLAELLDTLAQAIEVLPRRDSRKEPIIEPHYKMISIVHKLVTRGDLDPVAASENLREASSYACKVPALTVDSSDEGWEEHVLAVLKILRNADKSGWHHRMTARAAHIIYEGSNRDIIGALGAKHELTQSIFTKTMILQVWKPEFERPGRHFVYTSRYVRFFAELLDKTTDRSNFENLLKRIRKKAQDYFNHEELWRDMVHLYLKMLRRAGNVPENHEEAVFRTVPPEEFSAKSTALEKWSSLPGRESKTLEILREAVEIKKVNGHLLKPPTAFDDVIGDVYALLYQEVTPDLVVETNAAVTRAGTSTPGEPTAKTEQQQPLNVLLLNNLAEKAGEKSDANAPPSRTRTKVLRREVLRKAEAAGAQIAATVAMPGQVSTLKQSERDGRRDGDQSDTSLSAPGGGSGTNGRPKRRRSEVSSGKGIGDDKRSRTASIHDSADDESESELSDLEVEIDEERQEATITSRRKSKMSNERAHKEDEENEENEENEEEGDEEMGEVDVEEQEGEAEGDVEMEGEEEAEEDEIEQDEGQEDDDIEMEDAKAEGNSNVETEVE